MNKCALIVVTYNRKELLEENLNALLNQTYKNFQIFVIDNASTDGTDKLISDINSDKIVYYNTGKNLGGAGGFSFGIKKVIEKGYEYAWIMDDDSIPNKLALKSLVDKAKAINNNFSFMASLVYWTDNKLFDMNVPSLGRIQKRRNVLGMIEDIKTNNIISIETCSFVGCFINLRIAKNAGLPISEFFIYGDDIEYTARLKKYAPAYLDLDSIIVHKAPSNKGADIVTADKSRIARFYFQSRNGVYIARKNNQRLKRIKTIFLRFIKIITKSQDKKLKRINILISGSIAGIFFNPKIKYVTNDKNK